MERFLERFNGLAIMVAIVLTNLVCPWILLLYGVMLWAKLTPSEIKEQLEDMGTPSTILPW